MRSIGIISVLVLLSIWCQSQSVFSFEQYSFMGAGQNSLVCPVAHYESRQKWCAEARYNYEDIGTISLYAGKKFSHEGVFPISVTPMIGAVAGKMNGGSLGLNTECSYRKFNFSSQAQYSFSATTRYDNFFYNWSELYVEATQLLYAGLAVQHTRIYASNTLVDPGILLGFSYRQWRFPLYSFNTFTRQRYFVVGISWEMKYTGASGIKPAPIVIAGR